MPWGKIIQKSLFMSIQNMLLVVLAFHTNMMGLILLSRIVIRWALLGPVYSTT